MYLPAMYEALKPKVVVLLNLSRDQLHRTGEVRKVANLWHKTFVHDDVTLVIDRDDPFLEFAASQAGHVLRVTFGGRKHADAATCPQCSQLLDWSSGDYKCSCGLGSALPQIRADRNLRGPARNSVLAIEAARLMGAEISVDVASEMTQDAPDRVTTFAIAGQEVPTRLAKNPESWREALAAVSSPSIVLAINARGIDGRDTSWLWDVDYSPLLDKKVVCTGDRRLDIAYRLHVQGCDVQVAGTMQEAVELAGASNIEAIASYTAFQDLNAAQLGIRQVSGGRS
jgi:UDP-N-acetylmuramyl tripeptide synthase